MQLATYKTACDIFGWSQDKLYRWAKGGRIPGAVKIDGVWIFDTTKLYEFIRSNQCQFSKEVVEKAVLKEWPQIQP